MSVEVHGLREALVYWEKRRLVYNAVMLIWGGLCSVSFINHFGPLMYMANVTAFGIGANICYSLGPLFDVYVSLLLGRSLARFRPALFALGMAFSIFVVLVVAAATMWQTGLWDAAD